MADPDIRDTGEGVDVKDDTHTLTNILGLRCLNLNVLNQTLIFLFLFFLWYNIA